jgi:hypothetical protein
MLFLHPSISKACSIFTGKIGGVVAAAAAVPFSDTCYRDLKYKEKHKHEPLVRKSRLVRFSDRTCLFSVFRELMDMD